MEKQNIHQQKNNTLDLLKLFSSYMVVFIHVRFSGYLGDSIESLSRFAVPFFFLISGFYSYGISTQKIRKRISNILILSVFAIISYSMFNVLVLLSNNSWDNISDYFSKYGDFLFWLKLLIFNVPICSYHLWYLYAILYVYAIYYCVTKFQINDTVVFVISFALLFINILLGEVLSFFGIYLPSLIVRNFALMGIPFFFLGLFIKKYQHKFFAIPNCVLVLLVVIGTLESIFSRYFFGKNELYIGSLFILFAFVCVFIKYPTMKYPKFLLALEGCSTYIYIFHNMISETFRAIYEMLGINLKSSTVLENLHPIIVCISATLFSYLLINILKIVQRHKTKLHLRKVQAG